eukprot:296249-Rhodomonas_salina.1
MGDMSGETIGDIANRRHEDLHKEAANCLRNPLKKYKEKAHAMVYKFSVGVLTFLLSLALLVGILLLVNAIVVDDFAYVLLLVFICMTLLELLRERLAYLTDNNLVYQKLPARQFLCQPRNIVMSFLWIPAAMASGDRSTIYRVCCEMLVSGTVLFASLCNEEFFFGEDGVPDDFYRRRAGLSSNRRAIPNGEEVCEEASDWSEEECNLLGCCQWDGNDNACFSDIGTDECDIQVSGTFACEDVDDWDQETCDYIGCCQWDDSAGQCFTAVGDNVCRGFNLSLIHI